MRFIREVYAMDETVAGLLGLDLDDPEVAALGVATARDMDLIERLVQVRHDRGLTQREVAARMECSQPNVSAFERVGGDPHLSTLRRYANAIGAHVRWDVVVDGGGAGGAIRIATRKLPASDRDSFYGIAK